jgi:geranylgeranyl diphosphate synthase, type II
VRVNIKQRIQVALEAAVARGDAPGAPPLLSAAIRHAVFTGGARIRPQLVIAVSMACGDDDPSLTDASAAAIELLHCASLVHDDLPCFDDAATRRGAASVHAAFGERIAILAGDALIVAAFETIAHGATRSPLRLATVLATVASGVGRPFGIAAGQAWECEPRCVLRDYHRQKTGALFAAATMSGAQAAGADAEPWRALGENLGEAYQAADDIRDVVSDPETLGKPVGRDVALNRPSVTREFGLVEAIRRFDQQVAVAAASIPECVGASYLRALVRNEATRLVPASWCTDLERIAA